MRGDDDHADKDTRAKALTLAGVYINPADLDYSCLAVELATATDSLLKQLGDPQRDLQLQAATSDIDAERASEILRESSADQQRNCIAETSSAERMQSYAEEVGGSPRSDPTPSLQHYSVLDRNDSACRTRGCNRCSTCCSSVALGDSRDRQSSHN